MAGVKCFQQLVRTSLIVLRREQARREAIDTGGRQPENVYVGERRACAGR